MGILDKLKDVVSEQPEAEEVEVKAKKAAKKVVEEVAEEKSGVKQSGVLVSGVK